MKNGAKNKSVAFIILVRVYSKGKRVTGKYIPKRNG